MAAQRYFPNQPWTIVPLALGLAVHEELIGAPPLRPADVPAADVSRDGRTRRSLEASDTVRIPAAHGVTGEQLGLLADGIASRNALEAREDAIRCRHRD